MIRINFNPSQLQGQDKVFFDNWNRLAERAQNKLDADIGSGGDPMFRSDIWGALKKWLLKNVFHGKCAYCEINIVGGFVGDAEHYRPKAAVCELVSGDAVPVAHTGYYWIAYHWTNLIPSCQKCNSGDGKGTQFPIRGTRARLRTDAAEFEQLNALEDPLLLHPYDLARDPRDHLIFYPDGRVTGRDAVGDATIRILRLNRAELVELRRDYIQLARNTFALEVSGLIARGDVPTLRDSIAALRDEMSRPHKQFSGAIGYVLSVIWESC